MKTTGIKPGLLVLLLALMPLLKAQSTGEVPPRDVKELKELQRNAEMQQKEAQLRLLETEAMRSRVDEYRKQEQLKEWVSYGQSSELSLSKMFNGESLESEKSFEVQTGTRRISILAGGDVKNGVIEISILKPDGKNFNTVKIDNTSDLRWRQSLSLTEGNKEYTGTWKIIVKASKAEGSYNFRFTAE